MSIFTQVFIDWKDAFVNPNKAFSSVKEKRLLQSLLALIISSLISSIIAYAVFLAMKKEIPLNSIILFALMSINTMVILSLLMWIIAKILGGEMRFYMWFCQFISMWSFVGALSIVPFISYLSQIYGLYLQYLGYFHYMKLSKKRAVMGVVIFVAVLAVLFVINYFKIK